MILGDLLNKIDKGQWISVSFLSGLCIYDGYPDEYDVKGTENAEVFLIASQSNNTLYITLEGAN